MNTYHNFSCTELKLQDFYKALVHKFGSLSMQNCGSGVKNDLNIKMKGTVDYREILKYHLDTFQMAKMIIPLMIPQSRQHRNMNSPPPTTHTHSIHTALHFIFFKAFLCHDR